ncbi:hypothetical protein B4100_0298 [Heyndrickxia coagulans]|nr:hypothetical protein B4100_0298 [Heyndrickxia coagulans]
MIFCLIVCFGDKERNRGFHSILAQIDKAKKCAFISYHPSIPKICG